METKALTQWRLIDTNAQLHAAAAELSSATRLAIDTEFIGEKYFYAKLELLQISDGERIYLIDVPALSDLKPLKPIIGNPAVLKLFHASSQDLAIIRRVVGVDSLPLFDTQIAASLLGYGAQISLANLIREILGVEISSRHSTSDWSHRPLTPDQLEYAANDVLYLHRIHEALDQEMIRRCRTSWMVDEMSDFCEKSFTLEERTEDDLLRRVKDWMSLSGRELAVLKELAVWRERTAQTENIPRRNVMTDEGMIELAKFQPDTREKAQKLRRANVGQLMRHFNALKDVIQAGRSSPREEWPQKTSSPRGDVPEGLLELALALLRSESRRQEIAPGVIATTGELEQVVMRRNEIQANDVPLLHGWRYEIAGRKILDLLQGRIALSVDASGEIKINDRS